MTLSAVAEEAGMNRAAARRFLLTLVEDGYASVDGKIFSLKPKILELGFSALAALSLTEVVQPILDDLAEKLQESCFCVVLDGDSSVYIAAAKPRRVVNISIELGSRAPAYCMSSGRILLSSLSPEELDSVLSKAKLDRLTENTITSKQKLRNIIRESRIKGYSLVDQEYEMGLRSISVPIYNTNRSIIAALNVACPSARYTIEAMMENILPFLLESSSRITLSLSH